MALFDIFKKKESPKVQKNTICNHNDALPDSKFCPRCGAEIDRTIQKPRNTERKTEFDIDNCYICVLHFRCISAWSTPTSHPVKKYVVVYNEKYKNDFLECNDDNNKIRIKVDSNELTLEIGTHTEKISYFMNEVCEYHIPICDAMESWSFIISDAPIDYESFMLGYQRKDDGIYYNVEDM